MVEPAFILSQMRALLPPGVEGSAFADDAAAVQAACLIWDLSTNSEAAAFMVKQGIVPLLLRIVRNRSGQGDRLLETCLGSLANLVANIDVCDAMAVRGAWSDLCGVLLSASDASVLLELLRALSSALSTLSSSPLTPWQTAYSRRWLAELFAPDALAQLLRMLANTRRRDLLLVGVGLLSAASYIVDVLPPADQGTMEMPPAFSSTLLEARALPVVADLLVEHWRDGELCHAVLLQLEEMLVALTAEDGENCTTDFQPSHLASAGDETYDALTAEADENSITMDRPAPGHPSHHRARASVHQLSSGETLSHSFPAAAEPTGSSSHPIEAAGLQRDQQLLERQEYENGADEPSSRQASASDRAGSLAHRTEWQEYENGTTESSDEPSSLQASASDRAGSLAHRTEWQEYENGTTESSDGPSCLQTSASDCAGSLQASNSDRAGSLAHRTESAGLSADHAVWRTLCAIVDRAADMPIEAASVACALVAVLALVPAGDSIYI